MFALEISFKDGVSPPEMILVRRPQALIGASDYAHVVIEDMKGLEYQLRIIKDVGRRFRCKPVGVSEGVKVPELLEGVYDGQLALDTGNLQLHITCLDIDLALRTGEPPDRAGVRVLRQACAGSLPVFPAVVVAGAVPMVISFVPDQPVYIGRSNQCAVRLDSADISAKHARLGYESGQFWVEDLGSTNGTFVNRQQISGRVNVAPLAPIVLGSQISIQGVTSQEELAQALNVDAKSIQKPSSRRYPILFSVSEVARPARLVLPIGTTVTIGRDPASDMWLGAPHISRRHCEILLSKTGLTTIQDFSTNGTAYDEGVLKKGRVLELREDPKVLNFGGNLTVAVCFNDEQEESFRASGGAPDTFLDKPRQDRDHRTPGPGSTGSGTFEVSGLGEERRSGNSAAGVPIGTVSDGSITDTISGRDNALRELFNSFGTVGKILCNAAVLLLIGIFLLLARIFWQTLSM